MSYVGFSLPTGEFICRKPACVRSALVVHKPLNRHEVIQLKKALLGGAKCKNCGGSLDGSDKVD